MCSHTWKVGREDPSWRSDGSVSARRHAFHVFSLAFASIRLQWLRISAQSEAQLMRVEEGMAATLGASESSDASGDSAASRKATCSLERRGAPEAWSMPSTSTFAGWREVAVSGPPTASRKAWRRKERFALAMARGWEEGRGGEAEGNKSCRDAKLDSDGMILSGHFIISSLASLVPTT